MERQEPENTLRERVDELWDHLEDHHFGPSLTAADRHILRDLDAKACDETITERDFEQTQSELLERLRCYGVDHANGSVPRAYWEAVDADGTTNLQQRRSINGQKHISRHGRLWRVTMGSGTNRTTNDFKTANEAHLFRDVEIERRKTEAALVKATSQEPYRSDDQLRTLTEANAKAAQRKADLTEAMQPDPITGVVPSWSGVIRRPEYAFSNAGPKVDPRPPKTPLFDQ